MTRAGILAWAAEHELPVWVWTVNDEREGIARLTRVAKVAPPTASTVTTTHRDMIHGMTANAFLSVSLHPPLVLVSLGRCRMSEMLPRTGR